MELFQVVDQISGCPVFVSFPVLLHWNAECLQTFKSESLISNSSLGNIGNGRISVSFFLFLPVSMRLLDICKNRMPLLPDPVDVPGEKYSL